jgi:AcrR family transcriptional regulator
MTQTPEERILNSTIECINAYGLESITVKAISERANVNQAAISYYFRGKDKLIERALHKTLENAFNLSNFTESQHFAAKERVIHIIESLMDGALKYPGIARSHFHAPFMSQNYDTIAIRRINIFMDELTKDIAKRYKKSIPELQESFLAIAAASWSGLW